VRGKAAYATSRSAAVNFILSMSWFEILAMMFWLGAA